MTYLLEKQKQDLLEGIDNDKSTVVNVVYKTWDYQLFKKLKGNRSICRNKVDELKMSILHVGYVPAPILINNKGEVVDGQHRCTALKELNMPIYYMITDVNGNKESAFSMNMAQSKWRFKDFIDSKASTGNPDYLNLQTLLKDERYQSIPFGTKLAAVTKYYANSSNGLTQKVIKTGLLSFPQARMFDVKNKLEDMRKVVEVIHEKNFSGKKDLFLNAVMFLTNIEGLSNRFEFEVFLENFKNSKVISCDRDNFESCLRYVVKVHNLGGVHRYRIEPALKILKEKQDSDKKWVKNQLKRLSTQS